MFNMESDTRANTLWEPTILAAITGPLANELADRVIHDYSPQPFLRIVRALA